MLTKFSRLSLTLQLAVATTIAIVLLVIVAGYISITQSASALLAVEQKTLREEVNTTTSLLSTPYNALTPVVHKFARELRTEFDGEFTFDRQSTARIAGIDVPMLLNDGTAITNDFTKLDAFTKRWDVPATVFQRVKGGFLRVSTSLKTNSGERAYGTWLSKDHMGYQTILSGKSYVGYANLFGKHFLTQYDPVVVNGEVIAVLFVGVDVSASIEQAFNALAAVNIGDTGYLYVINNSGDVVYHPTLAVGSDLVNTKTPDGQQPFQQLVDDKQGSIRYLWDNGSGELSYKHVEFAYAKEWGWIVAGGTYESEFTAAADEMAWRLMVTYIFGVLAVILIIVYLSKRLLLPLQLLTDKIEIIGAGDLVNHGLAVQHDNSKNEVDRIEASMVNTVASLRALVNGASTIGDSVNAISVSVYDNAESQRVTSNQLSGESYQTASGIEEMSNSYKEVAENVNSAADNAQHIDDASKASSAHMAELMKSADNTTLRINDVAQSIDELNANVYGITQAVELIRGIADQTNLLALNAAIEAARAGEQGRGFSVVADEVRSLAKRTQESTDEIEPLVASFLSATQVAAKGMSVVLTDMDITKDKATESNELLANISAMVEQMSGELTSISVAVTEQSQLTDEMAGRQQEVNQIAESSDTKASQVLDSAKELNSLAEQLKTSLAQFTTK
ncbi:methyl-accepting chemotaxis protein [Thalassotalea euphylliae]|uniref:Methyl-accepting transducer domain-containing protein n=1 Tax=Thalassotalea euphylliae TaxID=1655234 RepID=A0A3E0TY96_9GAMM|nr:methyl-accepting chemotaxis protein [Thalassotalea euphylliae]REL29377.1 hypothetical protein DXX94_00820 [Thalassotalea euphylliae]